MSFSADMEKGLDTLNVLRRFGSLTYRRVDTSDSSEGYLTKTDKPSTGVKPCVMYALSKRELLDLNDMRSNNLGTVLK